MEERISVRMLKELGSKTLAVLLPTGEEMVVSVAELRLRPSASPTGQVSDDTVPYTAILASKSDHGFIEGACTVTLPGHESLRGVWISRLPCSASKPEEVCYQMIYA